MRPRWQKVLSDLRGNLGRTVLVIASIAVGLFAFGVIATLYFVIREDMRDGYVAVQPANIRLRTSLIDDEMIASISELPGVANTQGARLLNLRMQTAADQWTTIELHSQPDFATSPINQLTLTEGSLDISKGQILIERYKLDDTGAELGDLVVIEKPDGQLRTLEVAGVVSDQTNGAFSGAGGFFLSPVQGYVSPDTLNWLGLPLPDWYDTLYLTVSGDGTDEDHIQSIADQVSQELEDRDVTVNSVATRRSDDHPNSPYVNAISGVLLLLGIFIVFLSAFLITNTLQALLQQQVEQIGIMKTVGARRTQITAIYMMLILAFGILALLLAVPLTSWVSFQLMGFLVLQLNFDLLGFRIVPVVLILQALIAVLVPQVAAFIPIWRGSRLSVQEALSGVRQGSTKVRKSGSRGLVRFKLLSRPLLISLRNTFRSKGRMVLTLITLSLGGALFISTFNVQLSMANYIDQISQYFIGDLNVTMAFPYRVKKIETLLSPLDEITHVEGWMTARSELIRPDGSTADSVQLLAPPGGSQLVNPKLLSGRWLQPGDQNAIVLNELFLSKFPELQTGDTLRLQVNGDETEWIVVGFYQFAGRSAGYMAYTNAEYLSALVGMPGQAVLFRMVAADPNLTISEQEALGIKVQNLLEARGIQIAEVEAGLSVSQTAADGFSILTAFLLFMAVLAAVVGSIGLAGTMSINVMERTREIGIMRAIGSSNGILMMMVIIEGYLIGIISWALGSLLAFPITNLMSNAISVALFEASTSITYTATGFLIWFVVVSLLSIGASVLPARKAANLTIREVLAYE
ncbi:MAG: FtsX-like permease family protein [Anaerolineales bacterium]|nr:FtsX-like permease family protein [Anaerolineales bacterium]